MDASQLNRSRVNESRVNESRVNCSVLNASGTAVGTGNYERIANAILTEGGGYILLEDGWNMLAEQDTMKRIIKKKG